VSDSLELGFFFFDCHHTSYDYGCMQSSSHPARSRDLSAAFSSILHLLGPPSPNTIFPFDFPLLIYMMLYHPAALVFLMQQVQRLAIKREIRIVDVDRHLPEPGIEFVIVAAVRLCTRDEQDVELLLARGRHSMLYKLFEYYLKVQCSGHTHVYATGIEVGGDILPVQFLL